MRDLEQYASDELFESLSTDKPQSADDWESDIERTEHNFDFDSYAPYTAQEDEILSDYDKEYWQEAQDLADGGQEFKPSEWEQAKRHYVSCLAYTAFSAMFETAKSELIEAIKEVSDYATDRFDVEEPLLSLSATCPHGWASHDYEESDGTHVWKSGQLDGCSAVSIETKNTWVTCTWTPKPATEEEEK